ncbi:hypothetical protein [Loktanella sp. S4079]|uniref:hypothetical protein n=1 Tax=Loktanella sp. S4079 TaxID=579483 RepID=UPI0005FA2C4E|nr:hypothetical protein [Loktanella sp. S4079]KJZ19897.1 hypothetical protein TW80_03230 [Loktanella sp. S4079]
MAIEFTKSARQIAFEKSLLLVVAIIVGGCFAYVLLSGITDEIIVKIASAVALVVSIFMAIAVILEVRAVVNSGKAWRVVITDDQLSWESPIPEQMKPFQVALADIDRTCLKITRFRNSKRNPKKEWSIILRNRHHIAIDGQMSGINPNKVFEALETKGITFEQVSERKGSAVNISG